MRFRGPANGFVSKSEEGVFILQRAREILPLSIVQSNVIKCPWVRLCLSAFEIDSHKPLKLMQSAGLEGSSCGEAKGDTCTSPAFILSPTSVVVKALVC